MHKKNNYLNLIDKIEKIKSKNNVNWMDIKTRFQIRSKKCL